MDYQKGPEGCRTDAALCPLPQGGIRGGEENEPPGIRDRLYGTKRRTEENAEAPL